MTLQQTVTSVCVELFPSPPESRVAKLVVLSTRITDTRVGE